MPGAGHSDAAVITTTAINCSSMPSYLSEIASVDAALAAIPLQRVPRLLIDDSMAIGVSDWGVDVELLVDVAVAKGHSLESTRGFRFLPWARYFPTAYLQVNGEVLLSIDDSRR